MHRSRGPLSRDPLALTASLVVGLVPVALLCVFLAVVLHVLATGL